MRVSGVPVLCLVWIACVAPVSAPAALAADLWIRPEPAAPAPGQEITLRLFDGEPFAGRERPWIVDGDERFLRLWKKGRANLAGAEGKTGGVDFVAEEPGAHLVVYDAPSAGSYCKAVIVAGKPPTRDPLRWSELGQRLELVPQSDPVRLLAGESGLEVQVLFEREPLAGARVTAFSAAAPRGEPRTAVTDEIGLVRLRLDRPGWWLLRVRHRPRGEDGRSTQGGELTATLMIAAGGKN